LTFSTTTEPSRPAFSDICRRGSSRAFATIAAPVLISPSSLSSLIFLIAFTRTTPPPGTIPSSTAALVAERASSMRCFKSKVHFY